MGYQIVTLDSSIFESQSFQSYTDAIENLKNEESIILLVDSTPTMKRQLINITNQYCNNNPQVLSSFQDFAKAIFSLCRQLFHESNSIFSSINDLLVEIEWILEDEKMDSDAYYYDQITSIGTLINSKIVTSLLIQKGVDANWVDTRDLVITDESYRNPNIMNELTKTNLQQLPFDHSHIVLPNNIAATLNITTTTFSDSKVFEALLLSVI